jgi:hypothetical protein
MAALIMAKVVSGDTLVHYSYIAEGGGLISTIWGSNNFGVPISRFYYPQLSTHCFFGIRWLKYKYDTTATEGVTLGWQ